MLNRISTFVEFRSNTDTFDSIVTKEVLYQMSLKKERVLDACNAPTGQERRGLLGSLMDNNKLAALVPTIFHNSFPLHTWPNLGTHSNIARYTHHPNWSI